MASLDLMDGMDSGRALGAIQGRMKQPEASKQMLKSLVASTPGLVTVQDFAEALDDCGILARTSLVRRICEMLGATETKGYVTIDKQHLLQCLGLGPRPRVLNLDLSAPASVDSTEHQRTLTPCDSLTPAKALAHIATQVEQSGQWDAFLAALCLLDTAKTGYCSVQDCGEALEECGIFTRTMLLRRIFEHSETILGPLQLDKPTLGDQEAEVSQPPSARKVRKKKRGKGKRKKKVKKVSRAQPPTNIKLHVTEDASKVSQLPYRQLLAAMKNLIGAEMGSPIYTETSPLPLRASKVFPPNSEEAAKVHAQLRLDQTAFDNGDSSPVIGDSEGLQSITAQLSSMDQMTAFAHQLQLLDNGRGFVSVQDFAEALEECGVDCRTSMLRTIVLDLGATINDGLMTIQLQRLLDAVEETA